MLRRFLPPVLLFFLQLAAGVTAWSGGPKAFSAQTSRRVATTAPLRMGLFDKLSNPLKGVTSPFEQATALGKGMTVARLQVALEASDRSPSSILGVITNKAANCYPDSPRSLATFVSDVSVALLRKEADWVAAASETKVIAGLNQEAAEDEAEAFYNRALTKELSKFEKEYVPAPGTPTEGALSTLVVVSILAAVRGDQTDLGSVSSVGDLKRALQLLASNVMLERGELLVAAEVLWTPSESDEVLTRGDMLLDYPELLDL